MKEWLKISCMLCVFGFVREIRPSEPYITEYMFGEWHNFTKDQVFREIYPVGTYSYLAQLVIVFLITDLFRYKPLIITIGATGVIVWSMLLWCSSLAAMQTLEFFYGTYMAAEVAYYTYIYAKVDKKYFPRVTSHTRSAMLAGKLIGGISAQLLIYYNVMNYRDLNYISLTTQFIAMLWAFLLPKVDKSLYFHREPCLIESSASTVLPASTAIQPESGKKSSRRNSNRSETGSETRNAITPFQLLWQHFRNAYSNILVVQWSFWYALGFCGYMQVISYIQVLWNDIKPDQSVAWNGAVDAILTGLAALCTLAAGYLHAGRFKSRSSLFTLAVLSALEGGCLLMCCWTTDIIVSYVGFILFGGLYGFTITVASAEVARHLEDDSFGLIFGFNTLIALVIQTILTLVVVSEVGLALSIVGQYTVYAFYFITIGFIYFISVATEFLSTRKTKHVVATVE